MSQESYSYHSEDEDDDQPVDSGSESGSNSEEEPIYKNVAREIRNKRPQVTEEEREVKRARLQQQERRDETDTRKTGKKIAATTAGAVRVTIPNPDTTVMTIIFIEEPDHPEFPTTPHGMEPGGSSMTCILGPAAYLSTKSNSQSSTSLPCLDFIRPAHPGRGFVPGHLLNSQLRGPFTSNNMTALTSSANGQHKGFDNHVINAVGHLKDVYTKLNNVGVDIMDLGYGIHISIVVNPTRWGTNPPDDCISIGMTCTATIVKPPDVDALVDTVYPNGQGLPAKWLSIRQGIFKLMDLVQTEVDTANANGDIDNT